MKSPREQAMAEINSELARRQVEYPKQVKEEKIHPERARRQYKNLRDAFRVLDVMTNAQYNDYLRRWGSERSGKTPPTLFSQK